MFGRYVGIGGEVQIPQRDLAVEDSHVNPSDPFELERAKKWRSVKCQTCSPRFQDEGSGRLTVRQLYRGACLECIPRATLSTACNVKFKITI